MRTLYDSFENQQLALLESPTGTGKTLSIICSSMQWLRDNRARPPAAGVRGTVGMAETSSQSVGQPESDSAKYSAGSTKTSPASAPSGVSSSATESMELDWIEGFDEERRVQAQKYAEVSALSALQAVDAQIELARHRLAARRKHRKKRRQDGRTAWTQRAGEPVRKPPSLPQQTASDAPPSPTPRFELAMGPDSPLSRGGSSGAADTVGVQAGEASAAARLADAMRRERRATVLGAQSKASASSSSSSSTSPDPPPVPRLIFASRTHSQLTQFVAELRKTRFADARVVVLAGRSVLCANPQVRALGSEARISERCQELQDERRRGAGKGGQRSPGGGDGASGGGAAVGSKRKGAPKQRISKSGCSGCSYLNEEGVLALHDRLLVEPADVEEAHRRGEEEGGCPYYAARRALPLAEVIALPYSLLLQEGARQALGLDLRGAVVVVDEGHNLPAAVNGVYSVEVRAGHLAAAGAQVSEYVRRYGSRVKARSLTSCRVLERCTAALLTALRGEPGPGVHGRGAGEGGHRQSTLGRAMDVSVFLETSGLAGVQLSSLCQFLQESTLCKVARGMAEQARQRIRAHKQTRAQAGGRASHPPGAGAPSGQEPPSAAERLCALHPAAMYQVRSLLEALARPQSDGCVVVTESPPGRAYTVGAAQAESASSLVSMSVAKEPPMGASAPDLGGSIRYTLLHPASCFEPVLRQARSVVLAGGTMRPTDVVIAQLAPRLPPASVRLFSCGHVVPDESLLGVALGKGPSGTPLEFTFRTRQDPGLRQELGRVLLQLALMAPKGMVVFLPSYDFEKAVLGGSTGALTGPAAPGKASGALPASSSSGGSPLLDSLQARKAVFREPQGAGEVGAVLAGYEKAVREDPRGALLFAVMGGKLSEGLNFKDDLARLVVVVGLPYPNARDPELAARMARMEAVAGKGAGRTLYEGLCFQSVNQAVGRAIRHAGDWAAVCLLDRRFLQARTRAQLPPWIDRRTQGCDAFGQAFRALGAFYRGRRRAADGGAALPDKTQGAATATTAAASAIAEVATSGGAK